MKKFVTENSRETQKLGEIFAQELLREKGEKAKLICLEGDLGAGKTTFTQGLLKGLQVEGPYTSPTFVIMKEYKSQKNVYHIDAYRIGPDDILNLGWNEIISKDNIVVIEWADRIRKIIPSDAIWIKFKWKDKDKREIELF
jgi:tRNA threonylcarbamoyladenosine biosynthesis protein TsaE